MLRQGVWLVLLIAYSIIGFDRTPTSDDDACAPLPPPSGHIVHVSTLQELNGAVHSAAPGDTILIADGTYNFGSGDYLRIAQQNITLRSASEDRNAVILDGDYQATELIQIVSSDVTVADITLREALYHPIHVSTDGADTLNTRIYNVRIVDPGQQAIKINPDGSRAFFPDHGTVACSRIELTDAGRSHVSGCYTGGIDAHQAYGWTIRDNVIEGFWCPSGLSEHAIHLWRGSRDTTVERNVLRNNARGIGFGLVESGTDARTYADSPCPDTSGYVGHYGGIVRNNTVFADRADLFASQYGFDCGICLAQACQTTVVHNTVASTQPPFSSIEWRFSNTSVDLLNNLVTHNLRERDGASASHQGNLHQQPLSLFVDGASGDLHLASSAIAAIDQGTPLASGLCDDDIDGDPRPQGSERDVGADEVDLAPPAAVTDLRVAQAVTSTSTLTLTLQWSPPADAVTATLRTAQQPITDQNWGTSTLITDTLPGSIGFYTMTLSLPSDTVYFALRSWGEAGASPISNNAFWPNVDIFLPFIARNAIALQSKNTLAPIPGSDGTANSIREEIETAIE